MTPWQYVLTRPSLHLSQDFLKDKNLFYWRLAEKMSNENQWKEHGKLLWLFPWVLRSGKEFFTKHQPLLYNTQHYPIREEKRVMYLFNLEEDHQKRNNLLEKHQKLAVDILKKMHYDPDVSEQLQNLGYLQWNYFTLLKEVSCLTWYWLV